jgi:uncharacterized protein
MSKDDYSTFHALDPFFSIVMEGLSKYTDGEHYFDTLADDVLFEFRYHMAGWPESDTRPGRPHVALFRVWQQHLA